MTSRADGPGARWREAGGPDVEADVAAELDFHLDMLARDFERAGMAPEEARAAARARLGDVDGVRRWLTRHDRRRLRRITLGEKIMDVLNDVRLAARKLAQQPAFALAVISVLALGTGATTAIFSAVDAVLLRPLPFPDAERLVLVSDVSLPFDPGSDEDFPKGGPDIGDVRALSETFGGVAAYAPGGVNLSDEASPRRLRIGAVTPNLFATLGVVPALGRAFTPEEEVPGSARTTIVSDRLWRSYLGADPDVVGRTIVLNGEGYEVVGVMPPGFAFPEQSELWVPLTVPYGFETMRFFRQYLPSVMIARLAPGVTVEGADERVRALFAPYASEDDAAEEAEEVVRPFRDTLVASRRNALLVLLGATALVLVVASANVANLLLSRATVRRREIALRAVLGATPGRVLRQLGTESLVLALAGAAAGVGLALLGIRALDVLVPASLSGVAPLRIDGRVLAFALTVALATAVVFGFWPALQGRRTDAGAALRSGGAGSGSDGGAARIRSAFVVGEVALALMLLVGSTLMLRSLHALVTTDSGVSAEGVAALELTLAPTEHAGVEGRRSFYERVLERLSRDPRVEAAAAINELPLRGVGSVRFLLHPEGRRPQEMDVRYMSQDLRVTPDYFRVMGIRILAGRAPVARPGGTGGGAGPAGASAAPPTEVAISESMARTYWPEGMPVGEYLEWPGGRLQIVGVVADVRPTSLESEFIPQTYFPLLESAYANGAFVVRGRVGPAELARLLEEAVHDVAPTQAVYNVRSMEEVIEGAIGARRANTFLIAAFGALALVLSAVGVYGVMAYSVARRTREIGIRMALGARSDRVLAGVLREGLGLAVLGTLLGLGGAWALARVMESLLYEVAPRDPFTFVAAPAALLAVALLAALLPARRATRIDPVQAIRAE